jgi:hypothetical protein
MVKAWRRQCSMRWLLRRGERGKEARRGAVAPEEWSWAALGGRGAVAAQASLGGWSWGMELTARARLTERRGRGGRLGRREPKGKTYFPRRCDRRAGWMGHRGTVSAYGGGAASGLAGPKAEWATRSDGPKSRKRISELKIEFLNLPRLWKFVEGDLGGILT